MSNSRSQAVPSTIATALLCILALASALLAVPAGAASATATTVPDLQHGVAESPGASIDVRLNGTWRFTLGDDVAWAAPDFDDSGWQTRVAPQEGGQDDFDQTNGMAWFRRTFEVPAEAAGVDLFLSMGVIDDADEVYLNGVLAGSSGSLPPQAASRFWARRVYDIDESLLRFGDSNSIAVRMNDSGGGGGITRGPLALMSRDQLAADVFGVPYSAAPAEQALELLATQREALAAGDVDAYMATLSPEYLHGGFDAVRQRSRLERMLDTHEGLQREDQIVGTGVDADGTVVVELRRTFTALSDGERIEVGETIPASHAPLDGPDRNLMFVRVDAQTNLEIGDRARFFRDHVVSDVSDELRGYTVYLPPSYHVDPERRFPSVYLLHGAGGSHLEWEMKQIDSRMDALIAAGAIEETIVIMPNGRTDERGNTWYVDSSAERWRTMFLTELRPQVDQLYRTIDDRTQRGLTGWSMGGQGAFTLGYAAPDVFGSIASLSGALALPPLAGSGQDLARNAVETPVVLVNAQDPLTVRSFCYYLYAGEDDELRFDDMTRAMSAELAARGVLVPAEIKPSPAIHGDHVQLPGLAPSFRLHSAAFAAHDPLLGCQATVPANGAPVAADDVAAVDAGASVVLDVIANDSDPDHDPLRFGSALTAHGGAVADNGDGTLVFTHDGSSPSASVTYEVIDGRGLSDSATVTLSVS